MSQTSESFNSKGSIDPHELAVLKEIPAIWMQPPRSGLQITRLKIEDGHIIELSLMNTGLTSLPEKMEALQCLRVLDLRDNGLQEIPPTLGSCSALDRLYLDNNRLTALPEEIGALQELTIFSCTGNQITQLPQSLGSLRKLKVLYLSSNRLQALPSSLTQLTRLHALDLSNNHLREIPSGLIDLKYLEEMDCRYNPIRGSIFTSRLYRTPSLTELRQEFNSITPDQIVHRLRENIPLSPLEKAHPKFGSWITFIQERLVGVQNPAVDAFYEYIRQTFSLPHDSFSFLL